ncbi:DMT family transporter [uncultured Amnibacterium sp.]|uniref:DMT family transporter n=1 Tax=uncultured Amnibacterium sp. TaxID=1631851 RepID=UPI0035CA51BD
MLTAITLFALHTPKLNPAQAIGIPIALVGAVFLSLGAQYQHRGVTKVEERSEYSSGLTISQLLALLRRPSWLIGTALIGAAIVLQLISVSIAPLIVVQPLGAIGLVITAVNNARITKSRLNPKSIRAILLCVFGVGLFVTIAALTATDPEITDQNLIVILILLAVVVLVFAALFVRFRKRMLPVAFIIGAGVQYGFVATLALVIIRRIEQAQYDWLTVFCTAGLLIAGAGGAYFVQTAYSVGPPDLVMAGLTVVDPIVAVGIGIIVLGEAAQAPIWAPFAFVGCGVIAVFGVFQMARHHPQAQQHAGAPHPGALQGP